MKSLRERSWRMMTRDAMYEVQLHRYDTGITCASGQEVLVVLVVLLTSPMFQDLSRSESALKD